MKKKLGLASKVKKKENLHDDKKNNLKSHYAEVQILLNTHLFLHNQVCLINMTIVSKINLIKR